MKLKKDMNEESSLYLIRNNIEIHMLWNLKSPPSPRSSKFVLFFILQKRSSFWKV